jgi:hypothetical protein
MDRSHDDQIGDLRTQVAELRAVNAELGRALAAADAGTPLRSSITAALTLSRVEQAEQAAAAARDDRDVAVAERDAAVAERDAAVAQRDQMTRVLHALRTELAEQAAEVSRLSEELAARSRANELTLAQRDAARGMFESASAELDHVRALLGRRSVRTAQRAARAVTPLFQAARRARRTPAGPAAFRQRGVRVAADRVEPAVD